MPIREEILLMLESISSDTVRVHVTSLIICDSYYGISALVGMSWDGGAPK